MTNETVYIVMPAYNEADNIGEVINEWYPIVEKCGNTSRLVVANDGSKDNTYSIINKLSTNRPQLIAIDKPNSGHGATLMYLYDYALKSGAAYIFQTDSDGQTRPNEFWDFYNNRKIYDLQIGIRRNREDGFGRKIVSLVLRILLLVELGVWTKDANTPFRLMRSEALKSLMTYIPNDFFLCNAAISAIAVKKKYSIGWHKITFRNRQGGVNSINFKRIFKIGIKALKDFTIIRKNLKS